MGMGPSVASLTAAGNYTIGDTAGNLAELLRLIPDPDAAHGTGAVAGGQAGQGGAHLDEMSPGTAAQLRAEIYAMGGGDDSTSKDVAAGSYTVVAADDTANQINITTGLDDFTLSKTAVTIFRSGTEVTTAKTVSKQTGGVLRIADSTYQATAGDVVNWMVRR